MSDQSASGEAGREAVDTTWDSRQLSSMRIKPLDGMRAVAVLLVFVFHGAADVLPGGFVGVDVFFVISGFVITSILLREHRLCGRVDISAFWIRRALRLMPALALTLLLVAALTPLLGFGWRDYGKDAGTSLLYVYNFRAAAQPPSLVGHFWSLSVEEQFYLLWPLLLVVLVRRRPPLTASLVVAVAVATALSAVMALATPRGTSYFLLPGHAPELLVGAALASACMAGTTSWLDRVAASTAAPLVAAVGLAVAAVSIPDFQAPWLYMGGLTAMALGTAVIIAHVVVSPMSWVARVLSIRPLVWLGLRSYGFYLLHQPLLNLVDIADRPVGQKLVLALLLTLVLCGLSFRWVEQPALRLKARWERVTLADRGRSRRRNGIVRVVRIAPWRAMR